MRSWFKRILHQERDVCQKNGLEYFSLPIIDRSVPALDATTINLFERIESALAQGKKITVHCRQGIGRAGLVAASLLVARGTSPDTLRSSKSEKRAALQFQKPLSNELGLMRLPPA